MKDSSRKIIQKETIFLDPDYGTFILVLNVDIATGSFAILTNEGIVRTFRNRYVIGDIYLDRWKKSGWKILQ